MDPSAALERLEWWSWRATIIILAGIALEAWEAIYFRLPGESGSDIWTKVAADGLVGIGLAIEAVCIFWAIVETRKEKQESDEKVAAANERATVADKLAEEAVLALERLKAPRTISLSQQELLVAKLSSYTSFGREGGRGIEVGASPATFESSRFAHELVLMLQKAGIKAERSDRMAVTHGGLANGVVVKFVTGNEYAANLALVLTRALNAEGFASGHQAGLLESVLAGRAKGRDERDCECILIVVGDKL